MRKQGNSTSDVLIYPILFVVWAFWRVKISPFFADTQYSLFIDVFAKGIIWLLPLFLAFKKEVGWLASPRRMLCASFPWVACVGMLCAAACFLHTLRLAWGLQTTYVIWNWEFVFLSISAGIIEEFSFRGYFFNRHAVRIGIFPSAILNGITFALFHYPNIIFDQTIAGLLSYRFVLIMSVGIIFSLAFARWKNIWLTVIVHTGWNILSYMWAIA